MKSLTSFQMFMNSSQVPSYMNRYCQQLDQEQWRCFYGQMKEPIEFTVNLEELFYALKWILKSDFDDLSYALLFQEILNPESRDCFIEEEWWQILFDRYRKRINLEMKELSGCDEPS